MRYRSRYDREFTRSNNGGFRRPLDSYGRKFENQRVLSNKRRCPFPNRRDDFKSVKRGQQYSGRWREVDNAETRRPDCLKRRNSPPRRRFRSVSRSPRRDRGRSKSPRPLRSRRRRNSPPKKPTIPSTGTSKQLKSKCDSNVGEKSLVGKTPARNVSVVKFEIKEEDNSKTVENIKQSLQSSILIARRRRWLMKKYMQLRILRSKTDFESRLAKALRSFASCRRRVFSPKQVCDLVKRLISPDMLARFRMVDKTWSSINSVWLKKFSVQYLRGVQFIDGLNGNWFFRKQYFTSQEIDDCFLVCNVCI